MKLEHLWGPEPEQPVRTITDREFLVFDLRQSKERVRFIPERSVFAQRGILLTVGQAFHPDYIRPRNEIIITSDLNDLKKQGLATDGNLGKFEKIMFESVSFGQNVLEDMGHLRVEHNVPVLGFVEHHPDIELLSRGVVRFAFDISKEQVEDGFLPLHFFHKS